MPGDTELKQAGQLINTFVAIYSYIDKEFREQYKNNLIIINRHWKSANDDQKNTIYTPLYEGDEEGIKVSSRYVNSIIENNISAAGSLEYQLFRGRIVAARNTLIKFAKQRVENTIFFKKSKKVDEISFAINFIIVELEKCVGYNGTDFHAQQSHLNSIKDFVTKFLSDQEIKIQYITKITTNDGKDEKTSVSTDFSEKIKGALNHLKQMNQNRTSSEKFRGIAARSCRIAEKTLHLIIGILQPMTNLISGHPSDLITLMDAKDLQHGKIVTTVGGGKLELIHENIFINEIKGIAAAIVDPLTSKVIHLSSEIIRSRISVPIIQHLKSEYSKSDTSCPLVLYKKVLHKNEGSIHILADVHEFKRECKTILLFSNKTLLPKELDLHTIYIVKMNIKKNRGNMDEVSIYYAKDDKQVQEQKVDISSDEWSSISKYLRFPENTDNVVEIKESEKISELVKQFQLDSSIEQRLHQIGMMINLAGVLLQLNRFAHLVAQHASFRGDVAVYSEKSNDILFKALIALGSKIQEFYRYAEPLLNHIELMETRIGANPDHAGFMRFYMDKVKTIRETIHDTPKTKESTQPSLLTDIKSLDEFRENSTIGEDAKENERRLRELMIYLNKEYTLKLDSRSIALLGESSDNLTDKNLHTDQAAQIRVLSNPIKCDHESNPEIKQILMRLKALIKEKENSDKEIKKLLKNKSQSGGRSSKSRRSLERTLFKENIDRELFSFQDLSRDLESTMTVGISEQSMTPTTAIPGQRELMLRDGSSKGESRDSSPSLRAQDIRAGIAASSEHSLEIKSGKEEDISGKQSSNPQALFYPHISPQKNELKDSLFIPIVDSLSKIIEEYKSVNSLQTLLAKTFNLFLFLQAEKSKRNIRSFKPVHSNIEKCLEVLIKKLEELDKTDKQGYSLKDFFLHRLENLRKNGVDYFVNGGLTLCIERISEVPHVSKDSFTF